jgi:hypothetical protein
VKKGVLPEHDQIIPLGLQQQAFRRGTDLLPYLTHHPCLGTLLRTVLQELRYFVVGLCEQRLVTLHFVGGGP